MRPRARAYLGINHETIGSDILAVLRTVSTPQVVLGNELAARLHEIRADRWYPIELLLEMLDKLESGLGDFGLRTMGWSIFQSSHAAAVSATAKCARDIVYGIDEMYHNANRGQGIGGWKVLSFTPGRAELEKTTPHHCVVEEGILEEALRCVGAPARVSQAECVRKGAAACHFLIESRITGARWGI